VFPGLPAGDRYRGATFAHYFLGSAFVAALPFLLGIAGALLGLLPHVGPVLCLGFGVLAVIALVVLVPLQFVIVNDACNNMTISKGGRTGVLGLAVFFGAGPYLMLIALASLG
jgi:hypothetical protein